MVLKDAGVLEYEDADLKIRFLATTEPPRVVIHEVPQPRGVGEVPVPESNYDKLFRGNKPRLGTPAAE